MSNECISSELLYLLTSAETEDAIAIATKELSSHILNVRCQAAIIIQATFKGYRQRILYMAQRLIRVRIQAAVHIQKHIRGWLIRRDLSVLKNSRKLIKWTGPAKEVFLAGTFTYPEWTKQVKMSYSKALHVFYSTLLMDSSVEPGEYLLKFIVDGEWKCGHLLPTKRDQSGFYNNVMIIHEETQRVKANIEEAMKPITVPSLIEASPIEVSPLHVQFGAYMAACPKSRRDPLTIVDCSDRYFIDEGEQCFGLADGVGWWKSYGLDPGEYAQELMDRSRDSLLQKMRTIKQLPHAEVIQALTQSLSEAEQAITHFGSSTAMLALVNNGTLHIINVGDSSFIILRNRGSGLPMRVIFRSIAQQHSFNCPYQLTKLPTSSDYPDLIATGRHLLVSVLDNYTQCVQDSALNARGDSIAIQPGDIIIAGTDGLFDNLYDTDIAKISKEHMESGLYGRELASMLAQNLVVKAIEKGWDANYRSPYAKAAQRAGKRESGGKLDDTTVLVGVVCTV